MSAASTQILHKDRIPATGVLVIPGRLDFEQLLHLEKLFAGRQITWLIEENSHHDAFLLVPTSKNPVPGRCSPPDDAAPASAGTQLQPLPRQRRRPHIRPRPGGGPQCDELPHPVVPPHGDVCLRPADSPIAIDCPRESSLCVERKSSLPSSVFAIAKPIPSAESSVAAYHQALLEARRRSLQLARLVQRLARHGPSGRL